MKIGRQAAVVVPVILVLMTPSLIYSQTLDDFKTASQAKGVESIPFSSLRGDAASIQRDINNWKQTTASFKEWKEYDRNKIENYKSIRLENETIKKRQDYIKEIKSKNVDASQFEKELEDNKRNLKKYEDNIAAINNEVEKASDAWDRLARLRGGQREKFSDVLSKLSSAKSSPSSYLGSSATDDDKNKLIGYINSIEAGIKSEAVVHAEAEKNDYNAKQNMDNVRKRNSE